MLASAKSLKIKSIVPLLDSAKLSPAALITCEIGNAAYTHINIDRILATISIFSPIPPFQRGERITTNDVNSTTRAETV